MLRFHVVGFSGAGKTTLILGLIEALQGAGWRPGVVKHHGGLLSEPEKDSAKFHAAGAPTVLLADDGILEMAEGPSLDQGLRRLSGSVDVVLVEGFKRGDGLKIWVGEGCPADLPGLVAVVGGRGPEGVPTIPEADASEVFRKVLEPRLGGGASIGS